MLRMILIIFLLGITDKESIFFFIWSDRNQSDSCSMIPGELMNRFCKIDALWKQ